MGWFDEDDDDGPDFLSALRVEGELCKLIEEAHDELTIISPYMAPSPNLRRAVKNAAGRDVDLPGRYS